MKLMLAPSPHGGDKENHPRLIVIHAMAEYVVDGQSPIHAVRFLHDYGLSAHALCAPDGVVYRCRGDEQTAYHARGYNRDSLGLEFLVKGAHDYASFIAAISKPGWVSDEQLQAGAQLVRQWCKVHNIDKSGISRHSDLSPGRKLDPGAGFPWDEFIREVFA